jgi:hypothetical protein
MAIHCMRRILGEIGNADIWFLLLGSAGRRISMAAGGVRGNRTRPEARAKGWRRRARDDGLATWGMQRRACNRGLLFFIAQGGPTVLHGRVPGRIVDGRERRLPRIATQ